MKNNKISANKFNETVAHLDSNTIRSNGTRINLMVSSQCKSLIRKRNGTSCELSELRLDIKHTLEKEKILNQRLFHVWLNEALDTESELKHAREVCLQRIRNSKILIVIYNGSAGYVFKGESTGICHLELKTAIEGEYAKVIFVQLDQSYWSKQPSIADLNFRKYVRENSIFRGAKEASNFEEVKEQVLAEIPKKISSIMSKVVRRPQSGLVMSAEAMNWCQLNLKERTSTMTASLLKCFSHITKEMKTYAFIQLGDEKIQVLCHSLADSWSISRGILGRPQDEDINHSIRIDSSTYGPVHVVACAKNLTIQQVRTVIGNPDCIAIKTNFGAYAANKVDGVQFVFLKNCVDHSSIDYNLQIFLEWLELNGQINSFREIAKMRSEILKVLTTVGCLRKVSGI